MSYNEYWQWHSSSSPNRPTTSTNHQHLSVPVFPTRPSYAIYRQNERWISQKTQDIFAQASPQDQLQQPEKSPEKSTGNRSRNIVIAVAIAILLSTAIVIGVVLSQTLKTLKPTDSTTSNKSQTMNDTVMPNSSLSLAELFGNFTILNASLPDTSASDVCSNITFIINRGGQATINCTIIDFRQGSVKVRYKVDIKKESAEDEMTALKRASKSLAEGLTNGSVYNVDANSITFDDPNSANSGVKRNCDNGSKCTEDNTICISVVDSYACICGAGFHKIGPTGSCIADIAATTNLALLTTQKPSLQSFNETNVMGVDQSSKPAAAKTSISYLQTSRSAVNSSLTSSATTNLALLTTQRPSLQSFSETNVMGVYQSSKSAAETSISYLQTSRSVVNSSLTSSDCLRFCSVTQQCIPSSQICDKYQDCPDDIDEINCTCDKYHYPCINGRCIYKSWLCDGVKDCPLGDDEDHQNCTSCSSAEFACVRDRRSCLSASKRCDGYNDCTDASDESSCFKRTDTNLVNVTYRDVPGYYICSDKWNTTWSDSLCLQTGQSLSQSTSYQDVSGSFLSLNSSATTSNLLSRLKVSNCSSGQGVAVSCSSPVCGTRSPSLSSFGPYILNGQQAARGAWPWQVLFLVGAYSADMSQFKATSYCGGVLIDSRWILTAGHCVTTSNSNTALDSSNILIQLGSLTYSGDNDKVLARVDKVIVHPQYNGTKVGINDIGLVRLTKPVTFKDTVRPICLPSTSEDLSQLRVCVDTGYGRTIRNAPSENLLQVRMNILSYSECYNYMKNPNINYETQICVGTIPTVGDINMCKGDSGGPLSCQDQNGVWKVIGINSYVIGLANDDQAVNICATSIVSRVTKFVEWIQLTMYSNTA